MGVQLMEYVGISPITIVLNPFDVVNGMYEML